MNVEVRQADQDSSRSVSLGAVDEKLIDRIMVEVGPPTFCTPEALRHRLVGVTRWEVGSIEKAIDLLYQTGRLAIGVINNPEHPDIHGMTLLATPERLAEIRDAANDAVVHPPADMVRVDGGPDVRS